MTKLLTFAIAGALFAVVGCGPSTQPATTNTTPATNAAPAADAGAAQPAADGGAAPAPTP